MFWSSPCQKGRRYIPDSHPSSTVTQTSSSAWSARSMNCARRPSITGLTHDGSGWNTGQHQLNATWSMSRSRMAQRSSLIAWGSKSTQLCHR